MDKYRQHPAISNSDLKYLHDPILFLDNKKRQMDGIQSTPSKPQELGTMIDEYLLSFDTFFHKYIVAPEGMSVPSNDQQTRFVNEVIIFKEEHDRDPNEAELLTIYKSIYSSYKKSAELALFNTYVDYIDFYPRVGDKTIITMEQHIFLMDIRNTCNQNPEIEEWLKALYDGNDDFIEVYVQVEVTGFEWCGIKWKGKIDLVVMNHTQKMISVVDLKSTSKPLSFFVGQYMFYKYHRQQALYEQLINHLYKDDPSLSDYTIETLCWVVQTTYPNRVALMPVPKDIIKQGLDLLEEAAAIIKFYEFTNWKLHQYERANDSLFYPDWSNYLGEEIEDVDDSTER